MTTLIDHGLLEHPAPHEPVEGPRRRWRSAIRRTPLGDLVVEKQKGVLRSGGTIRWPGDLIDALARDVKLPLADLCSIAEEKMAGRLRVAAQGPAGRVLDAAFDGPAAPSATKTKTAGRKKAKTPCPSTSVTTRPGGADPDLLASGDEQLVALVREEARLRLEIGRIAASTSSTKAELARRLGMVERTLQHRAEVVQNFVDELGVDPERLARVPFGSLIALKARGGITTDNVKRLLATVETEKVADVRKATAWRGERTRLCFDLTDDQLEIVNLVLREVRRLSGTKSQGEKLAHIALAYIARGLEFSDDRAANVRIHAQVLMWHMERRFGGKFVWFREPSAGGDYLVEQMKLRPDLFRLSDRKEDTDERERIEALRRELLGQPADSLDGSASESDEGAGPKTEPGVDPGPSSPQSGLDHRPLIVQPPRGDEHMEDNLGRSPP